MASRSKGTISINKKILRSVKKTSMNSPSTHSISKMTELSEKAKLKIGNLVAKQKKTVVLKIE